MCVSVTCLGEFDEWTYSRVLTLLFNRDKSSVWTKGLQRESVANLSLLSDAKMLSQLLQNGT